MNESALRRTALGWLAAARPAVVVEVLEAQGSTPRGAGARMVVSADAVTGTIGGGHLELQAIADARAALATGTAAPMHEKRYALGPSLGQCCGGVVTLRRTPLDAASLARWPEPAARFHLQLYGAGHVGRAIVRVLGGIDCRVSWIDERDAEFPDRAELPPHIECVCVDEVQAEVGSAPAGAFHLVLTHSHALDLAIVEAVLRRGDFGFLGLIGSATKRARFEHRLQERGIGEELLQRMVCPIGVAGICGKEPEVIAVGVAAQLLQHAGT
jgi:xanthine dehydrogenase accessory factor